MSKDNCVTAVIQPPPIKTKQAGLLLASAMHKLKDYMMGSSCLAITETSLSSDFKRHFRGRLTVHDVHLSLV